MRLWSLNPAMLDTKGLVALWREGLGAQKALIGLERGEKVGYQSHPQLDRFKAAEDPVQAMCWYLWEVYFEAERRKFKFSSYLIHDTVEGYLSSVPRIPVTLGQLDYEKDWLYQKVSKRAPEQLWRVEETETLYTVHPMFIPVAGDIEPWERVA